MGGDNEEEKRVCKESFQNLGRAKGSRRNGFEHLNHKGAGAVPTSQLLPSSEVSNHRLVRAKESVERKTNYLLSDLI